MAAELDGEGSFYTGSKICALYLPMLTEENAQTLGKLMPIEEVPLITRNQGRQRKWIGQNFD